jgi:hypothetical protein
VAQLNAQYTFSEVSFQPILQSLHSSLRRTGMRNKVRVFAPNFLICLNPKAGWAIHAPRVTNNSIPVRTRRKPVGIWSPASLALIVQIAASFWSGACNSLTALHPSLFHRTLRGFAPSADARLLAHSQSIGASSRVKVIENVAAKVEEMS